MRHREGDAFAEVAAGAPHLDIAAHRGHLPHHAVMTLTTSSKAKGLCHSRHPAGMGCADPVGCWGPAPLPAPMLSALLCMQAAACTPRRQQQRAGEAALAGLTAAEGLRGEQLRGYFLYEALNGIKRDLTHANICLCKCLGRGRILLPAFLPGC